MFSYQGITAFTIILLRFTSCYSRVDSFRGKSSTERWPREAPVVVGSGGGLVGTSGYTLIPSISQSQYNHRHQSNNGRYNTNTKPQNSYQNYVAPNPQSGTLVPKLTEGYVNNEINNNAHLSLEQNQLYTLPPTSYHAPPSHHNHITDHNTGYYSPPQNYHQPNYIQPQISYGGYENSQDYQLNDIYGPPRSRPQLDQQGQGQQGQQHTLQPGGTRGSGGGSVGFNTRGTEESQVNFSAVGLLGLLAIMGMVQHVMTEMDLAVKPKPIEDFESGNSMSSSSGRPIKPTAKPTTLKPSATTKRQIVFQFRSKNEVKPRVKRDNLRTEKNEKINLLQNLNFGLSIKIVDKFREKILPSYFAVADALSRSGKGSRNSSVKNNKLQSAKAHAWKIYRLLKDEFSIPKRIARFCVSQSLKVMLDKGFSEFKDFWQIWDAPK